MFLSAGAFSSLMFSFFDVQTNLEMLLWLIYLSISLFSFPFFPFIFLNLCILLHLMRLKSIVWFTQVLLVIVLLIIMHLLKCSVFISERFDLRCSWLWTRRCTVYKSIAMCQFIIVCETVRLKCGQTASKSGRITGVPHATQKLLGMDRWTRQEQRRQLVYQVS